MCETNVFAQKCHEIWRFDGTDFVSRSKIIFISWHNPWKWIKILNKHRRQKDFFLIVGLFLLLKGNFANYSWESYLWSHFPQVKKPLAITRNVYFTWYLLFISYSTVQLPNHETREKNFHHQICIFLCMKGSLCTFSTVSIMHHTDFPLFSSI